MMTEIPKLESDQEETGTRIVLYCFYVADTEYNYVRVRSPDSDIFFIPLYYASKINITLLFATGSINATKGYLTSLNWHMTSRLFTAMLCWVCMLFQGVT